MEVRVVIHHAGEDAATRAEPVLAQDHRQPRMRTEEEAERLIVGAIDAGARVSGEIDEERQAPLLQGRKGARAHGLAHGGVVGRRQGAKPREEREGAHAPGYRLLDVRLVRAILARSLREQRPAGTKRGLPRDEAHRLGIAIEGMREPRQVMVNHRPANALVVHLLQERFRVMAIQLRGGRPPALPKEGEGVDHLWDLRKRFACRGLGMQGSLLSPPSGGWPGSARARASKPGAYAIEARALSVISPRIARAYQPILPSRGS